MDPPTAVKVPVAKVLVATTAVVESAVTFTFPAVEFATVNAVVPHPVVSTLTPAVPLRLTTSMPLIVKDNAVVSTAAVSEIVSVSDPRPPASLSNADKIPVTDPVKVSLPFVPVKLSAPTVSGVVEPL